ncbi:hypothetical protein EHS25_001967 [Saitozyma podzolica]|uniref:Uncharacterized protein n=1 Tax=Saitozyma podzolica TaxID=1890683 RepID=A0A427YE90_9TREE|nr:hypothetical protein EHS25_001967 [Saitozyma podzolica]
MAPDGGLTAGRRSSFAGEREVEQSPGDLSEADNVDPHEWESFLDDLNLRGPKRDAMAALPLSRKAYLLSNPALREANQPPPARVPHHLLAVH